MGLCGGCVMRKSSQEFLCAKNRIKARKITMLSKCDVSTEAREKPGPVGMKKEGVAAGLSLVAVISVHMQPMRGLIAALNSSGRYTYKVAIMSI